MRRLLRKMFTKQVWVQEGPRKKLRRVEVPPSERLVYAVGFAIAAIAILTGLEVAHMAFLGSWNSEVFAGIMSVITFIIGIFIGQKA